METVEAVSVDDMVDPDLEQALMNSMTEEDAKPWLDAIDAEVRAKVLLLNIERTAQHIREH